MGKRVANIGPQTSFPVHQGIFNYNGENVIAVSLWALGNQEEDLKIPSLRLVTNGGVYKAALGDVEVTGATWQEVRG